MWLFTSTDQATEYEAVQNEHQYKDQLLADEHRHSPGHGEDEGGDDNTPHAVQHFEREKLESLEVIEVKRRWRKETMFHIAAFLICATVFTACFLWVPRSPSISVKRTTVDIQDTTSLSIQQTYTISNRNVYSQRIKKFSPVMKIVSSINRKVYQAIGTNDSPNIDIDDFVIDKTSSRTILMTYDFLTLSVDDIQSAVDQCLSEKGIFVTASGTMKMQTFGDNFDQINIGTIPSIVHCTASVGEPASIDPSLSIERE